MKKLFVLFVTACVALSASISCNAQSIGRKDVLISLDQIHLDASFKQFKKATKMNQLEILTEFIRQANEAYKECDTIEEIRDLRENVVLINRYLISGKQSFMSAQKEYNILYNKINKTIREYEGGTTVYSESTGFYDFGQELN